VTSWQTEMTVTTVTAATTELPELSIANTLKWPLTVYLNYSFFPSDSSCTRQKLVVII